MAILLNNNGYGSEAWYHALSELIPDMPIYLYPEITDPAQVEYALIWNHPKGDLLNYPNLKAILLLGAGTEHIDADPNLPDVPVVRLIDPAVVNDMALYALYWVMHFHRRYDDYRAQAAAKHWERHSIPATLDYRVSVLGLGQMGAAIAERLAANGYQAQGWDKFAKDLHEVKTFHDDDGLTAMLAQTDVLINCLPLTSHTAGFLNAQRLSSLPQGACFINLSRGAVVNETDLLAALRSGRIAKAALDTFSEEPLVANSPFWDEANAYITPHIAGATYARSAARVVVANINRIEAGDTPFPLYRASPEQPAMTNNAT